MEKLLREYKTLRAQLTESVGFEESIQEVGWNDSIIEAMENLLKGCHPDIARLIRLGHI